MAQAGFTPIKLYSSSTATSVPIAGNLATGELAINITDGKLFYKDNAGVVQVIATKAAAAGVISFSGGTTGLTPNTATSGVVTLAGTLGVGNGGTGLTTLATGSLPYGAGTSAFSSLAIGTAGQVLTVNSGATAPQYVNQSTLSVGSATNVAGGAANQVHYQSGVGATAFVAAPTVASTFLQWTGSAFAWASPSGATLTISTGLSGTSYNGSAAVTIAIDSTVATLTGTQTLTNKRINPRVSSVASASSAVTPDVSAYDVYAFTAQAATLTINAPTGTPVDGTKLMFRILDNGTARTIAFNATYTAIGVTIPVVTVANKTTYVGTVYNANNTRWDVIAVTTQA